MMKLHDSCWLVLNTFIYSDIIYTSIADWARVPKNLNINEPNISYRIMWMQSNIGLNTICWKHHTSSDSTCEVKFQLSQMKKKTNNLPSIHAIYCRKEQSLSNLLITGVHCLVSVPDSLVRYVQWRTWTWQDAWEPCWQGYIPPNNCKYLHNQHIELVSSAKTSVFLKQIRRTDVLIM